MVATVSGCNSTSLNTRKLRDMKFVLVIILLHLEIVIGNDHCWRDYNGTIPSDALVDPDTDLIIAQISIIETCPGIAPAGLDRNSKEAATECDGARSSTTDNIKVLCTKNPERYYWKWVDVHNVTAEIKHGLVKGGYEVSLGNLYYGKVFKKGSWHLGKVVIDRKTDCYFFYKETGVQFRRGDCMILKYR